LEQAAEGTVTGRDGWANGISISISPSPAEGVFVSTRPGSAGIGDGGVLVSPTRDQREKKKAMSAKPTEPSGAGNGVMKKTGAGAGGDMGGLKPRFSPVTDTFVKKW